MYRAMLLSLGMLACLAQHLMAGGPGRIGDPGRFAHRAWTMRDGLPHNSVLAIEQTPEGYLWLGTMQGLVRFDGVVFRVFNVANTPETKDPVITTLLVAADSTLWIGTNGGLARMRNGTISGCERFGLVARMGIRSLFEDREGNVWVATQAGLYAIQKDAVRAVYTEEAGLPSQGVTALAEDSNGNLVVSTPRGLSVLKDDHFVPYCPELGLSRGFVTSLELDADGSLLAGTTDEGLLRIRRETVIERLTERSGLTSRAIWVIHRDRSGGLWVGTRGGGLNRLYRSDVSAVSTRAGFSTDEVLCIFEDREGIVWVGTSSGGLHRFLEGSVVMFPTGLSASKNTVWLITEDRAGRLLAGNEAGEMLRMKDGRFTDLRGWGTVSKGAPIAYVEDMSGVRWIGTSESLYRVRGDVARVYTTGRVNAILEDSRGQVWVGLLYGLLRYCGEGVVWYTSAHGLPHNDIRCITEARNGDIIVGTSGGGLCRFAPVELSHINGSGILGARTVISKDNGLLSNWVTSVLEDDKGILWVSTIGGGLAMVRPDTLIRFTSANGFPEDAILTILDDRRGSFWLSSPRGIIRVKRADLLAYAMGGGQMAAWTVFGVDDGLAGDECNGGYQSSGCRTRDGRLWFATTMGVAMINPDSVRENRFPPAVVIEDAVIERKHHGPVTEASGDHDHGELEIRYAGISLSAPQGVRFKFMLEGFDHDWVDAGTRRVAYYTNISPGTYTFRVIASNNQGIWNDAGSVCELTLRPQFYQTAWFVVVLGGLVLLLGASGFMIYRREKEREVRATRLESELTRAQLRALEMQLQPHFLFNTLNSIMALIGRDPDKAGKTIARLSEFLRHSLDQGGRQEVTLRNELELLKGYLQIEQLRFGDRLTVQEDVGPDLADALVPNMVLQPLVENAIKHGVSQRKGPALIQVRAAKENALLRLSIRDNGAGLRGLGRDVIKEGIGLSNTRARLRHLYGDGFEFELKGVPEGGVEVLLAIPYHTQETI